MAIFAGRLVQVQVIKAGDYKIRAVDEMENTRSIPAKRGEITDINGVTFARSVAAINIVVDQTQISDPARVAAFAAPILQLPVAQVQESITGKLRYSMVLPNAQPAIWRALVDAMAIMQDFLLAKLINASSDSLQNAVMFVIIHLVPCWLPSSAL
jgi:cell division protein FtsI (penicillin-binding protein 3)